MEVIQVKILDPRAMQILLEMQHRGWISIEAVEDEGSTEEITDYKRMPGEEFENYAAELLSAKKYSL